MKSITFDTRGLDPCDQVDFWQGVSPNAYSVRLQRRSQALSAKATLWPLTNAMITRFAGRAHRIERRADSSSQFLKLRVYTAGGGRIASNGKDWRLQPGRVYLIDHSRPWAADYSEHDQVSVFIPHALVGYDPATFAPVVSLPPKTPEARVLLGALDAFIAGLDDSTREAADEESLRLCALLDAILKNGLHGSNSREIERARTTALRRYAETHANDPHLDAATLARRFGVSRATVYRAFVADGGVQRFLIGRKLDRAFETLSRRGRERGLITRLADDMGFCSKAHFSDAFLDRFGMRPSAVCGLEAREPAEDEQNDAAHASRDLAAVQRLAREAYGRFAS